jgi:hypothetical protein
MVMLCKSCMPSLIETTKLALRFSDFPTNFYDFSKALD